MSNKIPLGGFAWLIVVAVGLLFLIPLLGSGPKREAIPVHSLAQRVNAGEVESLNVMSDNVTVVVRYKGGGEDIVYKEPNTSVLELLERAGVSASSMPPVKVEAPSRWGGLGDIAGFLIPIALVLGIFIFLGYLLRQPQTTDTTNAAFSFGKSRARRFTSDRPRITFDDVAGVEEAKEELQEIVEFLKHPAKFSSLGARVPKGILLVGPPGTGKTLLAKAVAGEAGVPFFSISGSEFVEMFVGVGASRVRDLFDQAKRSAPCIVFIDEIDAVGRQRGTGLGGGHDEREQTLNQILVELDGFDTNTNVIVMAATNRPDVLDPALLRPGRFDRQVVLDRPDAAGRLAILQVHARQKQLAPDVDLLSLARETAGFSGADLENLLNEAAILAARRNKPTIGREEISEAVDRVVAGPQRRSRIISQREKEVTAFHEMGHALVAHVVPNGDPVRKVSIVARGIMGGYTRIVPLEDRYLWTKSQFIDSLAYTLGGLAAEEIMFGEISSGASNDIERATELARRMVCEYGMSERLGPVALGRRQELVFLGRDIAEQRNYSDEVARQIDEEVRRFIEEAHARARQILSEHREQLVRAARLLMERETLEGEELERALGIPRRTGRPRAQTLHDWDGQTGDEPEALTALRLANNGNASSIALPFDIKTS